MKKEKFAIEMINITKKFGEFIANKNISIKIKKSSIHAIIGENGAGKSTLMNQLFGLLIPNSGQIFINGQKTNITNPNIANNLGLSMVHQHFQLVDNHTVLENIILGNEDAKLLTSINFKKARYKLLNISNKYKLKIDPNMLVKRASVGMQQRIEILKMLYRGAKILIFDEPTAMLTPQEIDSLLKLFIDLKNQGKTIIFISHKLEEVKQVSDYGTVIRNGELIKNFEVSKTSMNKMAEYMVGRKLVDIKNNSKLKINEKILTINNLTVHNISNPKAIGLKNLNLELYKGEILAIAGVEGNGQLEFINALFGLVKPKSGQIKIKNNNKWINLKQNNVNQRYKLKLSFVPEDRYKYAMLQNFNLYINSILQSFKFKPFNKYGILMNSPRNKWTRSIIKNFDVRGAQEGNAIIGSLSGGNQQKFIVGREMSREHKIIIMFQPTRGLDIGAIEFIHQKMLEEKNKGNSILLISYELNEVISLSDRVAVFNEGKLMSIAANKDITREKIGKWMAGIE